MSNLVIVESPAKAKTIQKYLGDNFDVIASMGHVRDLPKSKIGVDLDNNFEVKYENLKDKAELITSLKKAAKKRDKIYLATDPDREGEAISWHLAHILNIDLNDDNRVTFNEITKNGIKQGMDNPRKVNIDLVNAQQARRVLDRIVGYKLSPFLWRKVRRGLSAGRVQSVVVKIIVDREREIRDFKPVESWSIDANLLSSKSKKEFDSKATHKLGKKLSLKTKEDADAVLKEIEGADFVVSEIKTSKKKRSPAPPFTTSTLQQEAVRKLSFQTKKTMKIAQELYEGIDLKGHGAVGLITYMRTDSLRISQEAIDNARDFIKTAHGEKYLPESARYYKGRKNSQDGHEAIRPTMIELTPKEAKSSLSNDQYKLYKLIWERFIASQMADMILDTMSVDIKAGDYTFRSSGFSTDFDGFAALYMENLDEEEQKKNALPKLEVGMNLSVSSIKGTQHFTQPPARYTEASLIKSLEENGIGRPSTYAPTISTVLMRGYVEREAKSLLPTPLGEVTTELMENQFKNIVDVDFTADMEQKLDEIEVGHQNWTETLKEFYGDFSDVLETAEKNMEGKRVKIPDEPSDVVCDLCGKPMVIKAGRFGKFLACSGFPECKGTKKITNPSEGICFKCGGKVLIKKSKKGRGFYGCENYPNCDFVTWDKPLKETCPNCGSTLYQKAGRGKTVHCLKDGCGYIKGKE